MASLAGATCPTCGGTIAVEVDIFQHHADGSLSMRLRLNAFTVRRHTRCFPTPPPGGERRTA